MKSTSFRVETTKKVEIRIITRQVESALHDLGVAEGLATILVPHTTAAVSINENADPDVPADLQRALSVPSRRSCRMSDSTMARETRMHTFSLR